MSDAIDSLSFGEILKRIRVKLPIQNPLHSFVHNNILMMFEGKEFHEALTDAGELYRAKTYWPIERYKAEYLSGKILEKDIESGIEQYSLHYHDTKSCDRLGIPLKEYYKSLVFSDLIFNDDETQPQITNKVLWDKCANKMSDNVLDISLGEKKYRAKDYWEKYYNESVSSSTHPYIIRIISSFLDQGQSFWANPYEKNGFWNFFCHDIELTKKFGSQWQKNLGQKVVQYKDLSSEQVIEQELTKMNIPRDVWETFILNILFDLKGWAGMVNKLEIEPWQATVKAPNIKLVDYIAALILIESSLDQYHSQLHSTDLAILYGREEVKTLGSFQLTLALYQITESFQLNLSWVDENSAEDLLELVRNIDASEKEHKIRLWHEAYEHQFYREALNAVIYHENKNSKESQTTEAQVLFCIDDREESIRRHLEEVNPSIKTYGVVGFFGIDMKFSSIKNQRLIAQCPPVVVPSRIVKEVSVNPEHSLSFLRRHNFRGGSDLSLYYLSRTLFRGFFSTLFLGVMSIVPMFLQVFFPKQSKKLRESFYHFVSPIPVTEMNIEHTGEGHGYTKLEMANIVKAILDMCGFGNEFAQFVVMAGHGSSSNNNPFKQAYGCGACGGNAGIPNSRAFAKMANDPAVRAHLIDLGVTIPQSTYFVSAFHDTCTDDVSYYELDQIPVSMRADFEKIKKSISTACGLNAFERCQRFSSLDAKSSPEKALKHVRERAEDLAQPRPEYGHSTVALSILGHRDMTKGLFMNRRSFLLTYDWKLDSDGKVLAQIILGGVPVCVNITMDYYFSCVDNENFGCGSKLPLNLTSLLGVMTGSQGDLRIGLARQMVEIHKPIRNMVMIEAPLKRVKSIFDGHPRLRNILYNHWMKLAVYDPEEKNWYLFKENEFKIFHSDRLDMKHFISSLDRINKSRIEDDFSEIG
jgi:uncharacterized protein YbcC (UPF0753/DUF2309 family)